MAVYSSEIPIKTDTMARGDFAWMGADQVPALIYCATRGVGHGCGGKAGGGRGVEPMGVGVQHGLNPSGVSPERVARGWAPGKGRTVESKFNSGVLSGPFSS